MTSHTSAVRRPAVLVLCGTTAGMLLLDLHKVTIAIPAIERALQAGPTGIQLVSAAYVVCFAITLVPAGRIGDQGRRLLLTYTGLWLSLAASLVCALAPGVGTLVVGRAALGVSAGLLMPQMMGIVQQLYAPHERGKAFGTYGVCVSLATALGPSVGGLLVSLPVLGWRGVFVLNLPVTVALLVAAHALLPAVGRDQPGGGRRPDIDVVGLALGTVALVSVLAPLILTTGRPQDVDARWLALVPAAVAAVLFVRRSRARVVRGRSSVIDPTLLRIASFRNGVLVSLTWFASGPATNLGLMVYVQEARGLSAFATGLILLPSSATSVLGAHLGGRLVDRWGRVLSATGMGLVLFTLVSTLVLVHATTSTTALLVGIPLLQLVSGLGGGLVVSPNHTMTLHDVPREQGSAASAIGQLGQRVANSVGVALASVAYYSVVYGAGHTLATAPDAMHLTSFGRSTLVAIAFLLAALAVVLLDRRRQVRVPAAVPV